MAKAGCIEKIEWGALQKRAALQGCDGVPCKKGLHCTDRRGCIGKMGCIAGTEGDALQK